MGPVMRLVVTGRRVGLFLSLGYSGYKVGGGRSGKDNYNAICEVRLDERVVDGCAVLAGC